MNESLKVGDIVEAEVIRITSFGAFVRLKTGQRGLIHISQVADAYVKDVNDHLKIGDRVNARVVSAGPDGKLDLSLKNPSPPKESVKAREFRFTTFEEKLKKFLKESQERQADIRRNTEAKQK